MICLDTIAEDNGGAMVFPRAPLKIRQEAGLAIVYHNTIEDGNLDMSSIHEDEELDEPRLPGTGSFARRM